MMMHRILSIAFGIGLILLGCGCQSPEDKFSKSWLSTDLDIESPTGTLTDTLSGIPPETYYRFYPNGRMASYTRTGKYHLIDWELSPDEQSIYLRRQSMSLPTLRLEVYTVFENSWSGRVAGSNTIWVFKKSSVFNYEGNDLLEPERNIWRFKSDHRLTREELHDKVRNHLQYAADYFELVQEREQKYFEPRFLNLPFNFYSGAFGLQTFAATKPSWQALFYDPKEARDALEIYRKAVRASGVDKKEKDLFKALHLSFTRMVEHLKKQ